MQQTRARDFTVAVRLMSEPCLWRWEIRDPAQGEVVANSWTSEWMAYESPDEAFRAGQARRRFQRASTFVKALSSTGSWYSSGPITP